MMKIRQANVGMQNRPYQASPLPSELLNSGPTVQNLELLQRTEAQAIIQGGILISFIFNPYPISSWNHTFVLNDFYYIL